MKHIDIHIMITSFSLLTICSLSIVLTTYNTFSSYRICMATGIPIKSFNSIYRSVFVVCFMSFSRHHKLYATLMMPSTHIQHKIEMQIRYLFSCVILRKEVVFYGSFAILRGKRTFVKYRRVFNFQDIPRTY